MGPWHNCGTCSGTAAQTCPRTLSGRDRLLRTALGAGGELPTPGSGPPTAGGEWPGFGARVPSTWLEGQGPIRNLGGIHRALCPGVRATTTERTRAGAHRGGGSMPVGSSGCAYVCAFRGGTRVVHPSSRTDVSFSPRGQGRCPSAHGCRFRPLASLPCRRRQCCVLGGGGWPDARLCWCLQPAAPIGLSPFYRCPSHEPFASTGGGAHRPLTPSGPPSPSLAWGGAGHWNTRWKLTTGQCFGLGSLLRWSSVVLIHPFLLLLLLGGMH